MKWWRESQHFSGAFFNLGCKRWLCTFVSRSRLNASVAVLLFLELHKIFLDTLIQKINNFGGDRTDISSKKALVSGHDLELCWQVWCFGRLEAVVFVLVCFSCLRLVVSLCAPVGGVWFQHFITVIPVCTLNQWPPWCILGHYESLCIFFQHSLLSSSYTLIMYPAHFFIYGRHRQRSVWPYQYIA